MNRGDPRAVCFADPLAVAMIHVQALFYPNLITRPGLQEAADLRDIAVPELYKGAEASPILVRGVGFIGVFACRLLMRHGLRPIGLEVEKRKIEAARRAGNRLPGRAGSRFRSGYRAPVRPDGRGARVLRLKRRR